MKLTSLLLFVACLHVSATGLSQKVSYSGKDVSLEQVFSVIKQQTGYVVFFDYAAISEAKPVTLDVKDASVEDVLKECFKNQDFEFEIDGKNVLVTKKEIPTISAQLPPPDGRITGRITDPNGTPLGGANIIIKRTGKGTTTSANGEFKLDNVNETDILMVTYAGYQSKSVPVGKGTNFPISLALAVEQLDQVVLRGYGKVSNRLNVGNVSTVTAEQIGRTNVSNPMNALIGRIPNVDITPLTGQAYAPNKVEIRGRKIISGNRTSSPLILIDGVPQTVLDIGGLSTPEGGTGLIQNGFRGPALGQDLLFNVNPEDIESITVLKDAAATAIYGSQGGEGVILITTKRGKAGKLKFDVNVYGGFSKVTKYADLMNTEQYLSMRREAFKNDNIAPDDFSAVDFFYWDTTKYTNLQRYLFGKTGINHTAQIALSGGVGNTTYRIGANYNKISNIANFSGDNQKLSLSTSFNYGSVDQKLKVSFVNLLSYTKVNEIIMPTYQALSAPNIPDAFDSVGNLNYAGWRPFTGFFPYADLRKPYVSQTTFINTSLNLEYEVISGLKAAITFGFSKNWNDQTRKIPISSEDPLRNATGTAVFGANIGSRILIEPVLTYSRLIGKSTMDITLGGTYQKIAQNSNGMQGYGYVNDNLLNSISNATIVQGSDGAGQYKYGGAFGRLNYVHSDKYLLELSARRDGSTRFGPGKQFGSFWAVGAGWIFTEEGWLKGRSGILSFGKLRGSLGTVGSDNLSDYNFLSRWTSSSNVIQPYQGRQVYLPTQHFNPDLQWQENKKLEVGLNLGFFNERITLQSSWYRDRCGNQLVDFPLSSITGFPTVTANRNAVVQNSGLEFDLKGVAIRSEKIDLSFNFNIGINRNKLVSFPDLEKTAYASTYTVGQPLARVELLKMIGVDPQTGLYVVEDKNKDGVISNTSIFFGGDKDWYDVTPKYAGGFGFDFRWNTITLNSFFSFIKKPYIRNSIFGSVTPGALGNQSVEFLDRWQKPGDVSRFARYTILGGSSFLYGPDSDLSYSNGSFVRMRNVSVSYSLSSRLTKALHIEGAKFIIKGDNLLTFTKYEGVDPEATSLGSIPTVKTVMFGIQLTF